MAMAEMKQLICFIALLLADQGLCLLFSNEMQVWLTTGNDGSHRLTKMPSLYPSNDQNVDFNININADSRMQTMEGFGAALTSSAAYVIKNSGQYDAIINDLFGSGIGISYVRLPMGASDFQGEAPYSYDDHPNDFQMNQFSIEKDKHFIIPVLKKALQRNPHLKIIATPWSAPAWMKTTNTMFGGELKSGSNYLDAYAKYFVKFIQMYRNEGIRIEAITVQNEPKFSTTEYPSMKMSAQQEKDFIKDHLGPLFRQNNINTKILIYDHNWDGADFPSAVLSDSQAAQYVDGVAWHCYAGEHTAPLTFHQSHPLQGMYLTECSGGAWSPDFAGNLVWNMRILFIGQTNAFAKTVLLWNLALNENHGPKVGVGGCDNCRGVLTVPSHGGYTREVEYYTIGHMTKVVKPYALRIDCTHFGWDDINTVAFQNPDQSVGIVILNPSDRTHSFRINWKGKSYTYRDLPPKSVVSLLV